MREEAKGATLIEDDLTVSSATASQFAEILGTPSAAATASLVPFFGAVVGGEETVIEGLGLDLSRALMAGIDDRWSRPFEIGETVHARVFVEDVFTKGRNQFGVVGTEFTAADGSVVQHQSVTFIERGEK